MKRVMNSRGEPIQGLYRHASGKLYHRPKINGKPTWRVLNTTSVKEAQDVMAVRKAAKLLSKDGLERDPDLPSLFTTTGEVLQHYIAADCPGRKGRPRRAQQLKVVVAQVNRLLAFWKDIDVTVIKHNTFEQYRDFRYRQRVPRLHVKERRLTNGSCLDVEMGTLRFAFNLAARDERIRDNPFQRLQKIPLRSDDKVRHCREVMPRTGDDLHKMARYFFETPLSTSSGWQLLFEAYTGMRTNEVLRLRLDATYEQAGFIDGEFLHIARSKQGVNPYVQIHPALKELIAAFKIWRGNCFPNSPWWFPASQNDGAKPLNLNCLNHALWRQSKNVLGYKVTSHGMRAFYVTARRSELIPDAVIAAEIGDSTGAKIIVDTYGGLPPNWASSKAGKLEWMPTQAEPAWNVFDIVKAGVPENVLHLPSPQTGPVAAHA